MWKWINWLSQTQRCALALLDLRQYYTAVCAEAAETDKLIHRRVLTRAAWRLAMLKRTMWNDQEIRTCDSDCLCVSHHCSCCVVSQHKLFNEHLVSASGNPALVMRRKKHTEKEVHAHLISVVSVRLREGYTIREISLTKGKHPNHSHQNGWEITVWGDELSSDFIIWSL